MIQKYISFSLSLDCFFSLYEMIIICCLYLLCTWKKKYSKSCIIMQSDCVCDTLHTYTIHTHIVIPIGHTFIYNFRQFTFFQSKAFRHFDRNQLWFIKVLYISTAYRKENTVLRIFCINHCNMYCACAQVHDVIYIANFIAENWKPYLSNRLEKNERGRGRKNPIKTDWLA